MPPPPVVKPALFVRLLVAVWVSVAVSVCPSVSVVVSVDVSDSVLVTPPSESDSVSEWVTVSVVVVPSVWVSVDARKRVCVWVPDDDVAPEVSVSVVQSVLDESVRPGRLVGRGDGRARSDGLAGGLAAHRRGDRLGGMLAVGFAGRAGERTAVLVVEVRPRDRAGGHQAPHGRVGFVARFVERECVALGVRQRRLRRVGCGEENGDTVQKSLRGIAL